MATNDRPGSRARDGGLAPRVQRRAGELSVAAGGAARAVPHVEGLAPSARTSLAGLTRRASGGDSDDVDVRSEGAGWRVQADLLSDGEVPTIAIARSAQQAIAEAIGAEPGSGLTVHVSVARGPSAT